ncbi:hypothetical protein EVAR_82836_1 [Eumeta japonica]|uniref:Uncharacterized protein n=1 Tax=Eumeta variegata TaxID=151549 RepID=A0A4C1V2F7_EUMVA|nr:hypothetical protein EVAR_82836_1 [Eumeta japonica]
MILDSLATDGGIGQDTSLVVPMTAGEESSKWGPRTGCGSSGWSSARRTDALAKVTGLPVLVGDSGSYAVDVQGETVHAHWARFVSKSYLRGRIQRVDVNDERSSGSAVNMGVPQGSVLFADDTSLLFKINKQQLAFDKKPEPSRNPSDMSLELSGEHEPVDDLPQIDRVKSRSHP